jgi:3-hydroxybutyryl-CoA dehydratase
MHRRAAFYAYCLWRPHDFLLCNRICAVQNKAAWTIWRDAMAARQGHFFEDLSVGMEASYARQVQENDLQLFAELSGDCNPIHLDEEYAASTAFKTRIAHGALTASYISAVLGTMLPGPGAVYISQSLNFRRPVRIGDEVLAKVRIIELLPEKKRVILTCDCSVAGKTVLEGEALLMVPSREG